MGGLGKSQERQASGSCNSCDRVPGNSLQLKFQNRRLDLAAIRFLRLCVAASGFPPEVSGEDSTVAAVRG